MGGLDWELAWIQVNLEYWVNVAHPLAKVATTCPQTSYTGLQLSLLKEWKLLK